MDRKNLILAAMAPAQGALHQPVHVQKMFFLIDQNIASHVGGPHFDFRPYDYGPFDRVVYEEMEALAKEGLIEIVPDKNWRSYRLTVAGQDQGNAYFAALSQPAQHYIQSISDFVRSLSFSKLVSAIYKAYPAMRENSVFQG